MKHLKVFLLSLLFFVVLDFLWLGLVMSPFNTQQLREVGRYNTDGSFDVNHLAASFAYILVALSITFYVYPFIKKDQSTGNVFFRGAGLGIIIYGVFDFTNLAILKKYPLLFVFPDIAWGGVVFGVISILFLWIQKKGLFGL